MKIDHDLLKMNIEASSEIELNIDELLSNVSIIDDDYIKVQNKDLFMIFNNNYELIECAGNVITQTTSDMDNCEVK